MIKPPIEELLKETPEDLHLLLLHPGEQET